MKSAAALGMLTWACHGAPAGDRESRDQVGTNPDLVITRLEGPTAIAPGSQVVLTNTVCNIGAVPSPWSFMLFALSDDAVITLADASLGGRSVPNLQPGQCHTEASVVFVAVGSPQGGYYLGGIVDPFQQAIEDDESNNEYAGALLGYGFGPDFRISAISAPPSAAGPFTAAVEVCNRGNQAGTAPDLTLFASEDELVTPGPGPDFQLGNSWVGWLGVDECRAVSIDAFAPPLTGALYLGAYVDAFNSTLELVEGNNDYTGPLTGFGFGPDFVVRSLSAPPSVQGSFELSLRLCNQGTQGGAAPDVTVYASADTEITSMFPNPPGPDFFLTSLFGGWLEAGQCTNLSGTAWSPGLQGAYYLGALVDELESFPELVEANNSFLGALTGFGNGPDLVIRALSGPPSANGQFSIQSTVCNQGTTPSPWTDVSFYASLDQELTSHAESPWTDDLLLNSRAVPGLQPGQCDTQSTDAWWPGIEGAYHLAAIADEWSGVSELIESNNELIDGLIGFGNRPDLVVRALSGPPSANGQFQVQSTVCNQGTTPSSSTDLIIYASQDTTISPSINNPTGDYQVSMRWVPPLDPGRCQTESSDAWLPPFSGAAYLGAALDPFNSVQELIESNNLYTGPLMGFGNDPDLVVRALSGPPSASGQFQVSATVCNQGTQPGGNVDLTLYVSSDAILEVPQPGQPPGSGDLMLGNSWVGSLQPGRCSTLVVDAFYPGPIGAAYLGAVIDQFHNLPELIDSNNTLLGGLIGLGDLPDLVVRELSGPPSANGMFALRSTVCNQGTQPSPWSDVSFYASLDQRIESSFPFPPAGDLMLGARSVPNLQPGQCDTQTTDAWWPGVQGAYYLGAFSDEFGGVNELIESNNSYTGAQIGFGTGPDLVISAITAPPSASGPMQVEVRVCNQGTAPASSSEAMVFASADTSLEMGPGSFADLLIDSFPVGPLQPGQCATSGRQTFAPPATGAYYLLGVADRWGGVQELNEDNNQLRGAIIGLGNGPDLVISAITAPPSANGPFQVGATVCNQGTQPSGWTMITLYASTDSDIQIGGGGGPGQDLFLGSASMNSLQVGQCAPLTIDAWGPGPDGASYLAVAVDEQNAVVELIESNNLTVGGLIGFGNGPDLVVTAVSGPYSANGQFQVSSTVCNRGTQPSSGFEVQLLVSSDTVLSGISAPPWAQDRLLGSRFVSSLGAGQCSTGSTDVWWPGDQGAYYLGAIADDFNGVPELIESNNQLVGALIGLGNGPDLVITAISGPPSSNGQFQVSTTVCNRGTTSSGTTHVDIYTSADTTITSAIGQPWMEDRLVASRAVPGLNPGQCDSASADAFWPGDQGAYYLGAIVDPLQGVSELIESNNTLTGGLIGLGNGPDLVISAVAADPFALPNGQLEVLTTVCNQGTTASGNTSVGVYSSSDAVITSRTPFPWAGDALIGAFPLAPLNPGQCAAASVTGPMPGALGSYYIGAVADEPASVVELVESNNSLAGDTAVVATVFCGNGALEAGEQCDDGNFDGGDGCSELCYAEHRVWRENAYGTQTNNIAWNYAMGYHFTPQVSGLITELGGFFNGTKRVRLYNRSTGALLAEASVTAANTWGYTAITPVQVNANTQYTVAVYLAGTGGSYRYNLSPQLPRTFGDVRILGSTYVYTASSPNARPTNTVTNTMYGQADVKFVRR